MVNLILSIESELSKDYTFALNNFFYSDYSFFYELKKHQSVGWFNLEEYENYEKGADLNFLSVQNIIAPTILENFGYNKIIICYYKSLEQLAAFCIKNRKYKLIRKGILTNFALLERID